MMSQPLRWRYSYPTSWGAWTPAIVEPRIPLSDPIQIELNNGSRVMVQPWRRGDVRSSDGAILDGGRWVLSGRFAVNVDQAVHAVVLGWSTDYQSNAFGMMTVWR